MLNYDKMDEVLDNLDKAADSLKQVSELQTKFDNALGGVQKTIDEIKTENANVERMIAAVQELSLTHKSISDNIETILQDYKKLHSAFEYLELELKKNASAVNEVQKELNLGLRMTASFADETKKELTITKERDKKMKFAIFTGIGISIITLAAVVIGFFI